MSAYSRERIGVEGRARSEQLNLAALPEKLP